MNRQQWMFVTCIRGKRCQQTCNKLHSICQDIRHVCGRCGLLVDFSDNLISGAGNIFTGQIYINTDCSEITNSYNTAIVIIDSEYQEVDKEAQCLLENNIPLLIIDVTGKCGPLVLHLCSQNKKMQSVLCTDEDDNELDYLREVLMCLISKVQFYLEQETQICEI